MLGDEAGLRWPFLPWVCSLEHESSDSMDDDDDDDDGDGDDDDDNDDDGSGECVLYCVHAWL